MTARLITILCACNAIVCGQTPPSFTAAGVVNAATNQPVLAPYSICSVYGTELYLDGTAWASGRTEVPTSLDGVTIKIGTTPAGVVYVSANQINFLIPNTLTPGSYSMRVMRDSLSSTAVPIVIQETAPGIFTATHADGSSVTANAPARPGEIIIVYATGFGRTQPDPADRALAVKAAPIIHLTDLQVLLDGTAIDPSFVLYAGLTPGNAGLYQVNLRLPDTVAANPEFRVRVAGVLSPEGVRLPLQPWSE
jgi:uncharacterized protein (TIGR03437 family)